MMLKKGLLHILRVILSRMVSLIKSLYDDMSAVVRVGDITTGNISVTNGSMVLFGTNLVQHLL